MCTHNIGFYEEKKQNYHLIIIKYHQIRTLFLLLKNIYASLLIIAFKRRIGATSTGFSKLSLKNNWAVSKTISEP